MKGGKERERRKNERQRSEKKVRTQKCLLSNFGVELVEWNFKNNYNSNKTRVKVRRGLSPF